MTLTTTALALYHRTKAQFHQLTSPTALLQADHNHPRHPFTVAFPTHRTPGPRRRRRARPLTKAIRHLLTAYPPPPPLPPASPSPTPPATKKPPCRLCAATRHPIHSKPR
jgi:hypothetical protein